ncbi:acyltransferase family protein [Pseudomonas sp. NPDC007930]|uniref:acyltransferase family protein n=1 Tax=Pseudomonas sp. NPDC007930 TaxID=3364417 RepID=UPI0036E07EF0
MNDAYLLLALAAVAIALFGLATHRLPLLAPDALHRVSTLDGLRGLLATLVVLHHFAITWQWKLTGLWQLTPNGVINNFGAVAVSLFFMITGYLFTRKIRKDPTVNWRGLLVGRVLRIYPMYIASVAALVVIACALSAEPLGLRNLLKPIAGWLLFGGPAVAGYEATRLINASVQWSLLYEALFYCSLPWLCLLLRRQFSLWPVLLGSLGIVGFLVLFHQSLSPKYLTLFAVGMAVALAEPWLRARVQRPGHWGYSAVAVLALIAAFSLQDYTQAQMLLLGIPFALMVLGNTLGGLLQLRVLKVLGEVSFSVYLLHGIVLTLLFTVFGLYGFSGSSLGQFAQFWLLPVLWLAFSLSVLTYWGIERPFVRWAAGAGRARRGVAPPASPAL